MTRNRTAAAKLRSCISDLWMSRREGRTQAQIDRIDAELDRVEVEYFAVLNADPDVSYSELTGRLTAARNGLDAIRQEREQFTNALVTAGSLLGSISGVLGLLS